MEIIGDSSAERSDSQLPDAQPEHRNVIRGGEFQAVVQARNVYGGIHLNYDEPAITTPRQLPPPVRLAGRSRDLADLDGVSAGRTVLISGAPGIGKTALAVLWGHTQGDRYPDGQLFADLRGHAADGPARPSEILGRFLRALGIRSQSVPVELAELTALYRSVTNGRRVFVVLDDAVSAAQVRPLLPASQQGFAVITSRWRLAGLVAEGARNVQLERLEPSAAFDLLSHALGDERVAAEPDATRELASLCGCLPLALSVSAARLAVRPKWQIGELAAALSQEQRRLAALTLEDGMVVRASLDLSYRTLPSRAAQVYRLAGTFPAVSFDSRVVAASAAVPAAEAQQLLAVLTDANLLEDAIGGRYRFHDLIRLHALAKAQQEETGAAITAAIRRMLDWYLVTVTDAGQLVTPYRHDQPRDVIYRPSEPATFAHDGEALEWLEAELPNLVAVVKFAASQGHPTVAWQLVDALWPLFLRRGHYVERLELDRIALAAARESGHAVAEAKMLNRLGLAFTRSGRIDDATGCFRQALAIWRAVGDDHRIASSLRRLGLTEQARGSTEEALAMYWQALDAFESLGEVRPAGLTLIDAGAALIDAGRASEAVRHLRRSQELLAQVPDPYNEARAIAALGRALAAVGDTAAAKSGLEEALRVMRVLRSPPGEAEVLQLLGDLALAAGERADAEDKYTAALVILSELGLPEAAQLRARLADLRPLE